MKTRWSALLMLLSGCASVTVHEARQSLIGMNAPDLLACAGVPDRVLQISDQEVVVEYERPETTSSLFSLKVTADLDLSVGKSNACHMNVRILRDGTIAAVSFGDTSWSITGPQSSCAPLVQECQQHPDQTQLPKDYDAFRYLLKIGPHKEATFTTSGNSTQ